jgi:hypothetical protein
MQKILTLACRIQNVFIAQKKRYFINVFKTPRELIFTYMQVQARKCYEVKMAAFFPNAAPPQENRDEQPMTKPHGNTYQILLGNLRGATEWFFCFKQRQR